MFKMIQSLMVCMVRKERAVYVFLLLFLGFLFLYVQGDVLEICISIHIPKFVVLFLNTIRREDLGEKSIQVY